MWRFTLGVLVLSTLVACAPTPPPELVGEHHPAAVTSIWPVPSSPSGFDLDEDGEVDAELAGAFSMVQDELGWTDEGVFHDTLYRGSTILIVDAVYTDLTTVDADGGLRVFEAVTDPPPDPAPCEDESDTICGRHLVGGTFVEDTGAVTEVRFQGDIGYLSEPVWGPVDGRIALETPSGLSLDLQLERVSIHGEFMTRGLTWLHEGTLGAAIDWADLETRISGELAAMAQEQVAQDCAPAGDSCGCAAESAGEFILAQSDGSVDCAVDAAEIWSWIDRLADPDIDTDGDGSPDAVSFGVGFGAMGAFVEDGP